MPPLSAVSRTARSVALACLFAAGSLLPGCSSDIRGGKQNVILLVIDTLRADHLGCYGYDRNTSPHLDGLSGRSILFRDVTAQAPWTNPSVATLMTSLYPSSHHMLTLRAGGRLRTLDGDIETLAEVFRDHGYRTAAFTANPWLVSGIGIERGFETYRNLPLTTRAITLNGMAVEWMEHLRDDGPFFLYVHYMDVHGPYDPPAPYDEFFEPEKPGRLLEPEEIERMPEYLRVEGLTTLEEYEALYDGGIRYWDSCLSLFLADLRSLGILDESLLIVTADHGEEFLDHGGFNHGSTLFQEQLHVPLIWCPPHGRGNGRIVDQPVELVDVMPTLLSSLEIEPPALQQGEDLSPLLDGGSLEPRPAFSEAAVAFGGVAMPEGTMKSVKFGDRKAIVNLDTGELAVYDLSENPGESDSSRAEAAAGKEGLLSVLGKWIDRNRKVGSLFETGRHETPAGIREELEALGYIED